MIGRGENITRARWTLFEKLLCIECIANMENGDDDVNRLAGYYNKGWTIRYPGRGSEKFSLQEFFFFS